MQQNTAARIPPIFPAFCTDPPQHSTCPSRTRLWLPLPLPLPVEAVSSWDRIPEPVVEYVARVLIDAAPYRGVLLQTRLEANTHGWVREAPEGSQHAAEVHDLAIFHVLRVSQSDVRQVKGALLA